jgi:sugar phosphate isomerase/epimerase
MPESELVLLRQQLNRNGIEPAAIKCGGKDLYSPQVASTNRETVLKAVQAAALIGAKTVSVGISSPVSREAVPEHDRIGRKTSPGSSAIAAPQAFEKTADAFRIIADAGSLVGVNISIEMHQNSIADCGQSTMKIHAMVNHPNFGVNPDLGNLVWTYMHPEEDYRDTIALMAPKATYWHMKNMKRVHIPDLERTIFLRGPLWEGYVDFRWAVTEMLRAGYTGYGTIEGCGEGDHLSYVAQGLAYLRRVIEEAERYGV